MTGEVLASQSTSPDEVIADVVLGPCPTPVLFCKQMAHHLRGLDTGFLAETENVLLTRHPDDMLRSLSVQLPNADLDDTGLAEQVALLDDVIARGGTPIVLDSAVLLADPPAVLAELCARLELQFDDSMLSWPAGPKPYDGVWAPAWYANVHASTGFEAPKQRRRELPDDLRPVLESAMPLYDRLAEYAVGR